MYARKPTNLDELSGILETDLRKINKSIIKSQTVVFYDTCSISNHARINPITNSYDILDYFLKDDMVIITDKILEEMINPETGAVSQQYIDYLNALLGRVSGIFLFCECEIENLLELKYNTELARHKIDFGIKTVLHQASSPVIKGLIYKADKSSKDFLFELLKAVDIIQKNRGEISILLCLLIVDAIHSKNFRILTDDKAAQPYLIKPFEVKEEIKSNIAIESTPKVVQNLFETNSNWSLKDADSLEQVLGVVRIDQKSKILYRHKVDGRVFHNVVEEELDNKNLAQMIFQNSLDIVF